MISMLKRLFADDSVDISVFKFHTNLDDWIWCLFSWQMKNIRIHLLQFPWEGFGCRLTTLSQSKVNRGKKARITGTKFSKPIQSFKNISRILNLSKLDCNKFLTIDKLWSTLPWIFHGQHLSTQNQKRNQTNKDEEQVAEYKGREHSRGESHVARVTNEKKGRQRKRGQYLRLVIKSGRGTVALALDMASVLEGWERTNAGDGGWRC